MSVETMPARTTSTEAMPAGPSQNPSDIGLAPHGVSGLKQIDVATQGPSMPYGLPVWARIMIAVVILIVLGGVGVAVVMFGMLMMAFSMDSASASDIPDWFEIAVLVGWPVTVGAVVLVPAAFFAVGAKARWPIGSFVLLSAFSAFYIVACWIGLIAAIA